MGLYMYTFETTPGDYTCQWAYIGYIGYGPLYVQLQIYTCTVSTCTCPMCDVARHALSGTLQADTCVTCLFASHLRFAHVVVESSVHAT